MVICDKACCSYIVFVLVILLYQEYMYNTMEKNYVDQLLSITQVGNLKKCCSGSVTLDHSSCACTNSLAKDFNFRFINGVILTGATSNQVKSTSIVVFFVC